MSVEGTPCDTCGRLVAPGDLQDGDCPMCARREQEREVAREVIQ